MFEQKKYSYQNEPDIAQLRDDLVSLLRAEYSMTPTSIQHIDKLIDLAYIAGRVEGKRQWYERLEPHILASSR